MALNSAASPTDILPPKFKIRALVCSASGLSLSTPLIFLVSFLNKLQEDSAC